MCWLFIDCAPKNATWVQVKMFDGTTCIAHWANGGGEEQPPFRGWFKAVYDSQGRISYMGGIPDPEFWRPITKMEITEQLEEQIKLAEAKWDKPFVETMRLALAEIVRLRKEAAQARADKARGPADDL